MNEKRLVEVLLPLPFNHGFSYFVPDDLSVNIGDVVKVPFGSREIWGVVNDLNSIADLDHRKIKNIIAQDPSLKFNSKLLEFIKWVSAYNLAPYGAVLKLGISILNSVKTPSLLSSPRKRGSHASIAISAQAEILKAKQDPRFRGDDKRSDNREGGNDGKSSNNGLSFNLKSLSDEQNRASQFLAKQIFENKHSVTLIDGVTGSGKTEVYFSAIAEILKKPEGQVLILLPEIVLTTQLIKRFEEQFGFAPQMWHSKITPAKKRNIYAAVADGKIRIIIGARSSLFLPFKKLSLIIVDEEHESSFKQEDVVNYHGRDMAIVRAKIEDIPIILSSATPSLESYINAKNGKYHHLILEQKFSSKLSTKINLVDMRKEKLAKNHYLSAAVKAEIEHNLENKKQSLLFLNRRGYASLTLCKACGYKINCNHCSSYVTYHQKQHKFICHHCGYNTNGTENCPSCKEKGALISCGVGVEKIKEEVLKYFPTARIALITSDVITNLKEAEELIEQILNDEIDVIIGTQMIAKGHHFPSLAMVCIVDGDASFFSGDLRNAERSYQLLTQVIGRAGREKYQGQVILQTYNPDNLVFKHLAEDSKDQFMELEIVGRERMNMPPFTKMVAIIFSSSKEKLAVDAAKSVLQEFPIQENITIFGPAPMPITKVKGKFYHRLIIKCDKKINIQKLISQILEKVKIPTSVRVRVDVDPL